MAIYDAIDLAWSWNGDYSIASNGDLADTEDSPLQSIVNEIQTVIKSGNFDWERDVALGANLSDFQGLPNTEEIGKAIEDRVKFALIDFGIVDIGDLNIRAIPTHQNEILIALSLRVSPTIENGLTKTETIQIHFTYNSAEDDVFFILEDKIAASKE